MSITTQDREAFERELGCQVSDSVLASISSAGLPLYLALQEIVKQVEGENTAQAQNIRAIASNAFNRATN